MLLNSPDELLTSENSKNVLQDTHVFLKQAMDTLKGLEFLENNEEQPYSQNRYKPTYKNLPKYLSSENQYPQR